MESPGYHSGLLLFWLVPHLVVCNKLQVVIVRLQEHLPLIIAVHNAVMFHFH